MKRLAVFVFIDALGMHFLESREFLPELEYRRGLRSVMGYSCACHPTLFSGLMPAEHGHGAMFARRDGASPLAVAEPLRRLPAIVREHHRVRSWIHGRVARQVTGYFSLYECPTRLLPEFDLVEPRCIFEPAAIRRGRTIFDDVAASPVRAFVADWRTPESTALDRLESAVREDRVDWALVYLPGLDGLLHAEGSNGSGVARHLRWYEERIRQLRTSIESVADDFELFLFSDHGMSDVRATVDAIGPIEAACGENGRDYLAFYDSTMVRAWSDDAAVLEKLAATLDALPQGRRIEDAERQELGVAFPDRSQGDLLWVADEGTLIVPSYMGRSRLAGMHGYHPDAVDADACLLGLRSPESDPKHIRDLHAVMRDALRWVEAAR